MNWSYLAREALFARRISQGVMRAGRANASGSYFCLPYPPPLRPFLRLVQFLSACLRALPRRAGALDVIGGRLHGFLNILASG